MPLGNILKRCILFPQNEKKPPWRSACPVKKPFWLLFAGLWLVAAVGGSVALVIYSHAPGKETAVTPKIWPASSHLPRPKDQPTLVMFAHPKCPCTRASIGELSKLMTRCQGQLQATVVFFRPEDADGNWTGTDLWQSAAAIPGVSVRTDEDGSEAERFHAATSGHVVFYGADGGLLFSGGITEARGHAGDNAGSDAIAAHLKHGDAIATTPTFGCPLQEPKPPKPEGAGS